MRKNFTRLFMCCLMFAASSISSIAADKLMIVGDAVWGGWTPSNSVVMQKAGDNVFKATVYLKAIDGTNVKEGFKFLTKANWDCEQFRAGENNVVLENGKAVDIFSNSEDNNKDMKFQVTESANYDMTCDLNTKKLTVTKASYQDHQINHTTLWMMGPAVSGDWGIDKGAEMNQDIENPMTFKATVKLREGEFKIEVNNDGDFDQTFYHPNANDPSKVVFGGDDNKWQITKETTYDVTLNLADMTIFIVENTTSGMTTIDATNNAPAEYYTIDGKRVNSTAKKGIYIKRHHGKTTKVIIAE